MKHKEAAVFITLSLALITSISILILLFAQGYRINIEEQAVEKTGILSIHSNPSNALIYVNDVPQESTDHSITGLSEGSYTVKIEKPGYQSWKKEVIVEEGRATVIQALLISLFPEIKPLTLTGVSETTISPKGKKIAYKINAENATVTQPGGIWIMDLEEQSFSLFSESAYLIKDTADITYSNKTMEWSPDSQTILLTEKDLNNEPLPLLINVQQRETATLNKKELTLLTNEWEKYNETAQSLREEQLSDEILSTIPFDKIISWSPDETKILYSETDEENQKVIIKVLDLKPLEDKAIAKTKNETNTFVILDIDSKNFVKALWHPFNKQIVTVVKENDNNQTIIESKDIDGSNSMSIYRGNIKDTFMHPSGDRIIIITNFLGENGYDNLFSVKIL